MAATTPVSALDIVRQLWSQAQLPSAVLRNTIDAGHVVLSHNPEHGQAVRSSFQLTAVAQGCCAAIFLAQNFYNKLSALDPEDGEVGKVDELVLDRVEVDARHAIAEYVGWTRIYTGPSTACVSEVLDRCMKADSEEGKKLLGIPKDAVSDWDNLAGLYQTRSDRERKVKGVVRIHTNFPHHKLGILQLLNLVPAEVGWNDADIQEVFRRFRKEDVQSEVEKWDAFEFEAAAQRNGLCVTAYRTRDEWESSAMGAAVRRWMGENPEGSPFRISRITGNGSEKRKEVKMQEKQKSRVGRLRVIDMSRVIAGPISTRTLAAHGADVVLISSPSLPNLPLRELDTVRGKRTAHFHLPAAGEASDAQLPPELMRLIQSADVFSQAYRPHTLAQKGLIPQKLQSIRPGIVYAELTAFGFTGPWSDRRAYDSLTQTACGMNYLESLHFHHHRGDRIQGEKRVIEPKPMPVQALNYVAGSLMCFATLASLCRGAKERLERSFGEDRGDEKEGGEDGWKVQVSLASTAEWIIGMGQLEGKEAWERPSEKVLPTDEGDLRGLEGIVEGYRIRGLKERSKEEEEIRVLAIRHASIPPSAAVEECTRDQQGEGLKWTVPAHLGVDKVEWLS